MVSAILAISPGWIEKPASRIQIRAPFTSLYWAGSTAGSSSRNSPTSARV